MQTLTQKLVAPLYTLDRLLRGEATRIDQLDRGAIQFPVVGVAVLIAILGNTYGVCMGLFSLTAGGSGHGIQILASAVKVPLLFLLTLLVTFPSLYTFNALVGSRLSFVSILKLMIGAQAITLATLASLGPIVGFFSVCTNSYAFMVLLNVGVFAIAGLLGAAFLLQTLHRMTVSYHQLAAPIAPPPADGAPATETSHQGPAATGPLEPAGNHLFNRHVKTVFGIWLIVFAIVGAQMGWILRPFVGSPDQPFTWFRPVDSNFFEAVSHQLGNLAEND